MPRNTGAFLSICLAAVTILLSVPICGAQTKTTFDKFKNATHFSTQETETSKVTFDGGKDASILIHRLGMVVGFTCEGHVDSCTPARIEFLFIGHTSDWVMNGKNAVNLLIDGKPETAGTADWDGQVLEAENLAEYLDTMISPELLAKMAGAKTVDVEIGVFEFSLTAANLASIRDIAAHAGWLPEGFKKALTENITTSKTSSAAAAQLAQDGHLLTQDEGERLIQQGNASRAAVITNPAGAEVYIDGNKAGITPLAFVLIKRDNPRVLTIKLTGYKTVEKTLIPDGKNAPMSIDLEKEQ
jgi:hypothetical protein